MSHVLATVARLQVSGKKVLTAMDHGRLRFSVRTKLGGTLKRPIGKLLKTPRNRFDLHNLRLRRVRSEHPEDERNDVIRNGRVLGGLEPTRAFGDARYKWTAELQEMWVVYSFHALRCILTDT